MGKDEQKVGESEQKVGEVEQKVGEGEQKWESTIENGLWYEMRYQDSNQRIEYNMTHSAHFKQQFGLI